MALKKLMKGLEASLKMESEIHPKTKLGVWFHNLKMRSMEARISAIRKELINRKTKQNGKTNDT